MTALGRWAQEQLAARLPAPLTPGLSAGEIIARLAGLPDDEVRTKARRWVDAAGRSAEAVADELLRAAAIASPAQRLAAIDIVAGLGDEARSAWQAVASLPNMAAHAWFVLSKDPVSTMDPDQRRWFVTDYALAALATDGAPEAYYQIMDRGGLGMVGGGHPEAQTLRSALAEFVAVGGDRVPIHQLKVTLSGLQSPVWRRLLVPASATLGDLHRVIMAAFDWDGGQLHMFTVADRSYADYFVHVEGCSDEEMLRLSKALPRPGTTMGYVYDIGDWWEHKVALEKILKPDNAIEYPICTAGAGAAPLAN